jgi:hypothetical protein
MYFFFAKFIYNEYIRLCFLLHVVFTIFASDPPPKLSSMCKGLENTH